ncbi:trihelix transcription factor ASIL2 [Andrographis paniculata]|uniref:trihelix transcription factor ASIL2 n=1 Tax=Andrographis paniculata TaxID=175694 RepID=UPI0021E7A329|nr:trihelix transcription factor ASIL2 [Andrographis paniculata]
MATIASPSSPSPHDDDNNIPIAIPSISTVSVSLSASAPATSSRRLPPPCWSPEETVALIDAYKTKWYALRRGNLRANHWQEVADDVAARCPADTPKTSVQCRHKMEKLRKRYRGEIQRAAAHGGVRRFTSAWVHFQRMHAMEKGPNPTPPSSSSASSDDDDDADRKNTIKRINDLHNHKQKFNVGAQGFGFESTPASGVRIKFPGQVIPGPSYPKFDQIGAHYPSIANPHPNPNPNPRFPNSNSNKVMSEGFGSRVEMRQNGSKNDAKGGVAAAAAAIQALGEGFMRVEKAKMDMVRQIEEMRMENELKRTEMILDSQHRIVEAFAKAISERNSKKAKRDSTN